MYRNILCMNFRPDLINMEMVSQKSNRENLEQAFEIAESLGVTRLLDAEGDTLNHNTLFDLICNKNIKCNILTYIELGYLQYICWTNAKLNILLCLPSHHKQAVKT